MQVTYIPSDEVNSDLGVVNAARVSFGKRSNWASTCRNVHEHSPAVSCTYCEPTLSQADTKLIHYLASHNHWTPFAHSRLYFSLTWASPTEELYFYKNYTQAGMAVEPLNLNTDILKGSLYAWSNNVDFLPAKAKEEVYYTVQEKYPVYYEAVHTQHTEPFRFDTQTLELSESYVVSQKLWKLACATLLVKVPIFVARQIRTSQVGLAYSDLYVEGEAFAYNEVSRRYVSDEPEFYEIEQWRKREAGKIKQGSTGVFPEQLGLNMTQDEVLHNARSYYYTYATREVAPEQLRVLMPQSMYTEFYMTGTLHRWAQWLRLRLQADVQQETRDIAESICIALTTQFPKWAEAYSLTTQK